MTQRQKPEKLKQEKNSVTGEVIKNPNSPIDAADQPADTQKEAPESEKSAQN